MPFDIVDPVPEVPSVEQITDRFGMARERNENRRNEADRRAPLHGWQGIVLDIFV